MWRLQVLNKCQLILHTWPEEGARAVFWHWFGIKIVLGLLVDIVMSQNYIHIWWRVIKYECEEVRVLNPWKLAKGEKTKKNIPSPINLTALALESVDVWEFWHLPVFVTEHLLKEWFSEKWMPVIHLLYPREFSAQLERYPHLQLVKM